MQNLDVCVAPTAEEAVSQPKQKSSTARSPRADESTGHVISDQLMPGGGTVWEAEKTKDKVLLGGPPHT